MKQSTIKIYIKGGILAPVDLKKITHVAMSLGIDHFQFGRRQELIFQTDEENVSRFSSSLPTLEMEIDRGEGFTKHNIVSSYLASHIVPGTYWIKDGVFLDILDEIEHTPTLRVNITDLKQDIVYSFTGDLNFVASEEVNRWYVYFRTVNDNNLTFLPFLVYSEDIKNVISSFEKIYRSDTSLDEIITILQDQLGSKLIESKLSPRIKISQFFNYEGFHKYNDRYWLGIYMRNAQFDLSLLDSLCRLCERNRIGQLHVTPWKSIIVKDIQEETITDWKSLLAEHKINNGHSESELNWQINDFDENAYDLKAFLRKLIIKNDVCTNGVIIGINNRYKHSFSHIIIQRNIEQSLWGFSKKESYDLLYRKDFNPTSNEFITFQKNSSLNLLVTQLNELIESYHQKAYIDSTTFNVKSEVSQDVLANVVKKVQKYVYQCPNCLTTYDAEFGDESQFIPPKTPFDELPKSYICSICETEKQHFIKKNKKELETA